MKLVLTITAIVLISMLYPLKVHAIIVLPAIILIPIAHMVATVVVALGIPIASIGVLVRTISKNHRLAVKVSIVLLVAVMLISLIIFKLLFPENPLF